MMGERKQKLLYIAGPYRAPSFAGVYDNIQNARRYAIKYWLLGYAVICPHMNTAFLDGIGGGRGFDDAALFLGADLTMLERCDVIVMTPGWSKSSGSLGELSFAKEKGLEIIYEGEA